MVRFSLGLLEENEAEEGPGSSSSRPCPKRRKTSTTQQPPPPPPPPFQQPPSNHGVEDLCVESESEYEIEAEEGEEEEEEESEFEEDEEEDEEEDDQGEEELENHRQQHPDLNEESCKDGPISVTLTDPDVLDCPICLDSLSIPVFQVVSSFPLLICLRKDAFFSQILIWEEDSFPFDLVWHALKVCCIILRLKGLSNPLKLFFYSILLHFD